MSARAPARVNVIDIEKFVDQRIRVKFQGGREFVGTLKGFDGLVNLVLDDAIEYMRGASFRTGAAQGSAPRGGYLTELSTFFHILSLFTSDPADPQTTTETTRYVGLVVARGTAVTIIGPEEGMCEIDNPFLGEEAE